ncbi:hypothetical protein TRFO_12638 [Tritrichomonas foetus]|uniref:Initiator binding domain-containing protein n=1 Tax=Tritrichomonas foetus TaxID=1144522 RepID=A0A1J4L5A5_9EUKA|nr:hypothetical protein TRFO_12638 [Tritrichomonas foetus]|eukprot:OHT17117.1 hypothetical protein TRFO_12638 [Tritrichomonas foetus]
MFVEAYDQRQMNVQFVPQAQLFSDPLICKLTYQEQNDFARITTYFQLADDRNKRNFGMTTFIKHLNLIHHFVVRDDGNDALRGIICGILFGSGFLLVNTEKLKRLTRRSKSCVNGCFQKLGFGVYRSVQDLNGFFSGILPEIAPQWINPRHWCIRKANDDAPICFIASLPSDLCAKYGFPVDSYQIVENESNSDASTEPSPSESSFSQKNNQNNNANDYSFFYDIKSLLNRPQP